MLKICHITTVHNRFDTRIFQKQCVGLARLGYEVTLLCNDGLSDETVNGVRIESVRSSSGNPIMRIIKAPRMILSLAVSRDADIYQIHDPELIPAGLKLRKKGKKVIFDSHEDLPRQILEKEWIPWIFRRFISFVAEMYLHRVLKKFNAVLTVTPHIVEILKKSSDHVFMVTNYPILEGDFTGFSVGDYVNRENILCYSGTVYKNSLQENILKSIETINDLRYFIVGSLGGQLMEDLKAKNGWSKVQYIEKVPKKELVKIYGNVTIGIVLFAYSPNMGNNYGTLGNNKIFEYMYFGLPVICTDFVLWKEIIDKYRCGIYVHPDNIDGLHDAIEYLIKNKAEAYQMGQNGRKAVLDEYNWDSQEKTYIDVIRRVSQPGN